jgi:hypothetical protein
LIRQLLTESVLLSGLGGAMGVLFALWIKDGLLAVGDWGGRGMRAFNPQLDWRVLSFTVALSLATGVLLGLAPAWRATKVDLTPTLKDGRHGSSALSRSLLSRGGRVAVALVIAVGRGGAVCTLLTPAC